MESTHHFCDAVICHLDNQGHCYRTSTNHHPPIYQTKLPSLSIGIPERDSSSHYRFCHFKVIFTCLKSQSHFFLFFFLFCFVVVITRTAKSLPGKIALHQSHSCKSHLTDNNHCSGCSRERVRRVLTPPSLTNFLFFFSYLLLLVRR